MGFFGQPGDSLGRKYENLTDQERKRLFYRDRAKEQKEQERAEKKARKLAGKAEKMERQRKDWEQKAKWLAARNKLEAEKRKRREHSTLRQFARRI
jgi:hypothetical protein